MDTHSRRAAALVAGLFLAVVVATLAGPVTTSATAAGTQRGTTSLTAPVVQPGGRAADSGRAQLSGSVRFRPAKKGRPVVIQRRVGDGKWRKVGKERQNRRGTVGFTGAAYTAGGTPYTYRGVALRWKGMRKVAAEPQSADVWQAAFTDEFTTFDTATWADRVSNSDSRGCAKVGDPRARSVSQGTLRLKVMLDPDRLAERCTTDNFRYYLNGQVSTQHVPLAFTYGTFAARIKFPRNRGQHGSFWLQPVNPQFDGATPAESGAEIDIVEFFGKGYPQGGLASFLYNYGIVDSDGDPRKIGGVWPKATRMLPGRDNWWKRYHVFSLEWTPRKYVFRVDGREHFTTTRGVTRVEEYLILSMLTSDWELAQAKNRGIDVGGTMYVDWARVWQN